MLDGYIYLLLNYRFPDGTMFATTTRTLKCYNLLNYTQYPHICSVNVCSKKEAEALAKVWNEEYKKQGRLATA